MLNTFPFGQLDRLARAKWKVLLTQTIPGSPEYQGVFIHREYQSTCKALAKHLVWYPRETELLRCWGIGRCWRIGIFPYPSTTLSLSINNAAKPFGLKHLLKNQHLYPSTMPPFDNCKMHGTLTKKWLPILIFIIKTTIDINTVVKGWYCWWIGILILKQMLKPKWLSSIVDG